MAANVMTGFCRITVVAPDVRVDVALPEDVPLAELLPDVLRMADQWQNEGAHSGFSLARLDGGELDTGLSLAAQGVRNGDLLYLRAATETLPPPVYDDVVDAIASTVADDNRMWSGVHFRRLGLIGGSLVLAVGAWVLWSADDPHGMPAAVAGILAVLLTIAGGVSSRSYKDHIGGAVLGGCAVPYAFLAGLGVLPLSANAGLGRSHFIVACAAVLVVAVIGGVIQEEHDEVYVAAGIAATVGADRRGRGHQGTHASPVKLAMPAPRRHRGHRRDRPTCPAWPCASSASRCPRWPTAPRRSARTVARSSGRPSCRPATTSRWTPPASRAARCAAMNMLTGLVAAYVRRGRCARRPGARLPAPRTAAMAPGTCPWRASSASCSSPAPGCCAAPRRWPR